MPIVNPTDVHSDDVGISMRRMIVGRGAGALDAEWLLSLPIMLNW
jgi:hypothetical protein